FRTPPLRSRKPDVVLRYVRIPITGEATMVAIPKERLTIEEYIEFDKNSEERWEYFDGVIASMSGGSLAHNQISVNLLIELRDKESKGCEVLPADMRMKVPKAPPYRYADIV